MLFRAVPRAYGSSQARGQNGTAAAGHSHSIAGSKPNLPPTPQLTTLDPRPTERGPELNPHPHGYELDLFLLCHNGNSPGAMDFSFKFIEVQLIDKGVIISAVQPSDLVIHIHTSILSESFPT